MRMSRRPRQSFRRSQRKRKRSAGGKTPCRKRSRCASASAAARCGEITLDFKGKAPGRGAYVCPNVDCLKKARKAKALERGFDCQIPQEVYDALTERMEAEHGA